MFLRFFIVLLFVFIPSFVFAVCSYQSAFPPAGYWSPDLDYQLDCTSLGSGWGTAPYGAGGSGTVGTWSWSPAPPSDGYACTFKYAGIRDGVHTAWLGICVSAPLSSCTDGIKNGTETGIDCGGSCPACDPCAGKKSIGGCNAFAKYCEDSPEYSQSALFLQAMPDFKEFGYFRTTTSSGAKYVCAAWYRDNTGKVNRTFSGSYVGVDPLITRSCVAEPVFNSMNNTVCDANGTTPLNGFDTKIYVDMATKTYKKMNESGLLVEADSTVKIDLPDGTSVTQNIETGSAITTDKDGKSTYVGLNPSSGIGYDEFKSDILADNSEFKALFSKFFDDMKASSFFSLPESLFKSFPSGGTPDISFDAGRYGTHTYNFSTAWHSIIPIFKGIVIIVFAVVSVKVVILKGGGG